MRPKQLVKAAPSTKISSNSAKLVSGLGFSNGCAELALKKPPPSPLKSLMASCEATGPRAMVYVGRAFKGRALDRRAQGLRHALRDEEECRQHADWEQDVESATAEIDPIIANGRRSPPCKAADQRDGDCHSGRGRKKRMNGDAGHLAQIAQRRLPA
jgi:hypothetical protein